MRSLIPASLASVLWGPQDAVRRRWRRLRGLTGEFDEPEDSDRCRALTAAWARRWPDADPIGHQLRAAYPDRWIRFHTLPGSKRYAESVGEYAEIARRQRVVLAELLGERTAEDLVIIAADWDATDLATGQSKRYVPNAWPWRRLDGEDPGVGFCYLWVRTGLAGDLLDKLLRAIADDRAIAILAAPDLGWLFCPYDGGMDIILPDADARDALRDRHSPWLSSDPSGL